MNKLILGLLLFSFCANAQIVLQAWTQVYGTVRGQSLGRYVSGRIQSPDFPYKAAVSKVGSTGVYLLQTQTDTMVRRQFFGENLLTGDLNNDGHADVVVTKSVNGWDTVLVYWGTMTGIDTTNSLKIPGQFLNDGLHTASIGDVNNDGNPDLILAAPYYPNPGARGKVYVYLNPVMSVAPNDTITGTSIQAGLGRACAVADMNNDGFNDLVVRGNNQDSLYDYINIYWGARDTLRLIVGLQLRGAGLVSAGLACFDANGDGIDDLLWTNRPTTGGIDRVYIHYGGVSFDTAASLVLQNPGAANFGSAVVCVGDMNGDRYPDIGAAAYSANITDGYVFVFGGGPRIDARFDAIAGMDLDSEFGWSVSSLGDVTGDGLSDIIVGAPNYAFGDDRGYWGIFKGDSTIRVTDVREEPQLPNVITLHQAYPNPFNPRTTIRYDLSTSATTALEVFDLLGQHVATLVKEKKSPGSYQTVFDGSRLSSGVYVYRLTASTAYGRTWSDIKKLLLVR